MKVLNRKTEKIITSQWNGEHDSPLITGLRDLSYTVVFQAPKVATEKIWDDETEAEKEIPARGTMVVVGTYNWDTLHVSHGEYVTFHAFEADKPVNPDTIEDAFAKVQAGEWTIKLNSAGEHAIARKYEI